ncbi:MAG TPA: hypothetical protein VFU76_02980 [Terriglobales bacterium]|nr:hypothetical protein [Terriglobales bacterium]
MEQALLQIERALGAIYAFLRELTHDAAAAYRKLPARTRMIVLAAAVFSAAAAGYLVLRPSSVDVHLTVRHPFRTADMTIAIDGENAYSGQLTAKTKKKLLIMDRVEGSFAKTFALRPGAHTVEVHIRSEAYAYDQSVRRSFDAPAGRGGTLVVSAVNGADLTMNWLPVPPAGEGGPSPAFLTTVNSLLLTALGTILSATVGYFVQEFLKSRRAAPAAAPAAPTTPATGQATAAQ